MEPSAAALALSRLEALRDATSTTDPLIEEMYVNDYHDALEGLGAAATDLAKLRIPSERVVRRATVTNYRSGDRTYSKPSVERPFFMAKLHAAIAFGHRALPKESVQIAPLIDPRRVLVIYGRNQQIFRAMFAFLRALDLNPLEFSTLRHDTRQSSPWVGDILRQAFSSAAAFVVVVTGDDEGRLRKELLTEHDESWERELTPQARQNVIFEAGMAVAWDERRTVIVHVGRTREFSDILGRHTVRLDNTSERRKDLALRLRDAGCDVNMTGDLWLSEGDFRLDTAPPALAEEGVQTVAALDAAGPGTPELEPPGFLELLADQQIAQPQLTATLSAIAEVQTRIGEALNAAASEMSPDADPVTKLLVANRLAQAMTPLTDEYTQQIAEYEGLMHRVSAGMDYLIGRMEEEPALIDDQARELAGAIHTLRDSIDEWKTEDLAVLVEGQAKATRSLAKPSRTFASALRRLQNASNAVRAWDERLQAALARHDSQ